MNAILTTVQAIIGIVAMLFSVFLALKINRKLDRKVDSLIEYFGEWYAQEKTDIVESLPTIAEKIIAPSISAGIAQAMTSFKMSNLGKMSGMSRQMKGLEQELIADGLGAAGIPGGPMIAKYLQKYPFLMNFVGAIANQKMQNPQRSSSGELGKIG